MRESRVQTDPVSSGASHSLLSASENRVHLTFFPPSTGRATLSNESPVVAGTGLMLTPGMNAIELDLKRHGTVVWREWYVIYDGTTSAMSYIDSLG